MMELIATVPSGGGYFSLVKILVMLALITPWLIVAPWVDKDAIHVRAPKGVWNMGILAAGGLGILIWLLTPLYIVGLLIYVLLVGATLGAYVVYRNSRVPDEQKVLTREHLAGGLSKGRKSDVKAETRVKLYHSTGKVVLPPTPETPTEEVAAYNLAQELLYSALWYRASEVDIAPVGEQCRVRFVIDGVVSERPPMALPDSEAVIQYLKPLAGMAADDRRRPQQGKITVDLATHPVDMMLVTAGSTTGQRMQFRVVQEIVRTNLDELGMSQDVLDRVRATLKGANGLSIVSAKAGNGMTSTLYSLLREADPFTRQLVTLEAKKAVDLENVTQNQYGDDANLPTELISELRRDPDVIMVDHCPDVKTADAIQQASAEKTVLLGMRAPDSFTALAKWMQACGGPDNAATAVANLRGVLCQVLIRKLCPNCREAYPPDPGVMAKLNLSSRKVERLFRPPTRPLLDDKGQPMVDKNGRPIPCSTCQGNGYFGRTAVFEFLEVTDEIRQLIASRAGWTQIKAACRKNRMLYIQEQALRKVLEGITGIQEVLRVTQPQEKK